VIKSPYKSGVSETENHCIKNTRLLNTKKTNYMKVAIYTRISKETSDHTNQLLVLREYCQKMGYEIYHEYVDTVSGASANKPEFNRMMQRCKQKKI
jgi:hypothetical protein